MEKELRVIAICGWAIPEKWFDGLIKNAFPNSSISVHYPNNPADKDEAKNILDGIPCDLYIGYSFGSLWLLNHREYLSTSAIKALLAPIIDFTQIEFGSKVPRRNLKYMIKQIQNQQNPIPKVREFFKLCGINIPEQFIEEIPDKYILNQGLQFLLNNAVSKESLDGFLGFIGSQDSILDSSQIKSYMPQLEIIPNIGHEPELLLDALSKYKLF